MTRILLVAIFTILPIFMFAQEPIVSGENVYVQARLNGAASRLIDGTVSEGSQTLLQVNVASDNSIEILREGDRNPVLTESELSGRRRLVGQDGQLNVYLVAGTLYFIAYDPTASVGQNRIAYVMSKTLGGEAKTLLASGQTQFPGYDPRSLNAEVMFTWLQTVSLKVSTTGRVIAYGLATTPQQPGFPTPIPQVVHARLESNGNWTMVYNNQLPNASQAKLTAILDFCVTGTNTLYILGKAPDAPKDIPTSYYSVFRVVNREIQQARPYTQMVGVGMDCTENGVQTYSAEMDLATNPPTLKNYVYATIPDSAPAGGSSGASAEQPYFKALVADTVPLNSRDIQTAIGSSESIAVLANGSLMKMGNQPKLIKSPNQSPNGNVQQAVKVGSQIAFLLGGRGYYVFTPNPQSPVSGRPRDTVTIACGRDCTPAGRVPSFQLRIAGQDVPYGVSSTGDISFTIPLSAPQGTYEGTVNISGLLKSVIVNVRGAGEPATPTITTVTTPSDGFGPFAPRSTVKISFTGDTGKREAAGTDAAVKLAGTYATCDGDLLRLLGINQGTLTAVLPNTAGQKSQCNLVLLVEGGGVTVQSAPYRINLAAVANSPYTYSDFGTGQPVPLLGSSDGFVGSIINPFVQGSKVRAFGTGCGATPNVGDTDNVPEPGLDAGEATIQIGGDYITAKSTIAPVVPGLCYFDFTVPQNAASGRQTFSFVGSQEFFSVWVK